MYDTVKFKLYSNEVGNVDFIEQAAPFLERITVDGEWNGIAYICGLLNGLEIVLTKFEMKIYGESLCKWILGDNLQTMGRKDAQNAIEQLSDTFHLPIGKARITRLDVGINVICKYPVEVYLNHLGEFKHKPAKRDLLPYGSVYYKYTNGLLCVYDKIREQKSNRKPIPEIYEGQNVLRYEQRYLGKLPTQLDTINVTASMLYDETFYINVLDRLRANYYAIQKTNDISLNIEKMKTKQQLYRMGVLTMVKDMGGETVFIEKIKEAQIRGELTKKQAYDLRQAIKEACKEDEGFTVESDAIKELDKKIKDGFRFSR